ncbi:YhjD/YihY/BrkB family envelope integrity protein [Actinomycetospora sp. NBRC 106375]|uniref:YihY/virulence factor BrkB family protein n=1 Tax=Actinomycetospora sp. NBRC 106375 TaxID=3032207 RepID=UPI002552F6F9|nr:YhjD/YihY/BrkB family envelope integrity protein [Actinomycetospora sp. NBRC 106375]
MAPAGWRRQVRRLTPHRMAPSWRRLRETRRVYRARHGDHLAAAVTFFTVLALVPLLMLAVSAVGFVLSSSQTVFAQLEQLLADALPQPVSTQIVAVVHVVVAERGTLGVLGLAAAAVTGWSWISHLRDAVTALLGRPIPERRLRHAFSDAGALLGIGMALAVSFALAALTGVLGRWLLDLLGLAGTGGARALLSVGSLVIGFAANWLVVAWCLAHLPRPKRALHPLLPAAAAAAVGLVVLQQIGGLYLRLMGGSPTVTALGTLVGFLLIVYLVVRWLFLVTVWTETDTPDAVSDRSEAGRAGLEFVADLVG